MTAVRFSVVLLGSIVGICLLDANLARRYLFGATRKTSTAYAVDPVPIVLLFEPTLVRSRSDGKQPARASTSPTSVVTPTMIQSGDDSSMNRRRIVVNIPGTEENDKRGMNQSKLDDASIVITSSLIPSHPSVRMINDTIQSVYQRIQGLRPDSPLIIAVDGVKPNASDEDRQRHAEMLDNLRTNFTNAVVLTVKERQGLTRCFKMALERVNTKFLYLLQHDLMFIQGINQNAMIKTMEEYPDKLRVVRFNIYRNVRMHGDQKHACFGQPSFLNDVNGIQFTKTGHWSDNNQFATKKYYEEIFHTYFQEDFLMTKPMEFRMQPAAANNCSYEGPWLYGKKRKGPYILHLDGKKTLHYQNKPNTTVAKII
eukprot:CAMPEP_0119009040 /NCGR_PEP_ID=MMETSP1176-20130426/4102_1 /TAXON_ID=265551 /ORGANISM="Synedropsis recta cf, Strain CCMP1620" /LENGTH=368 /DNA_ID=CAMNT_0006961479 /DNA_START=77 /DNA_END=1183 /DNA_ORIENTATION=-